MGFFGGEDAEPEEIRMPQIEDWAPMDRLREEFDAVGFYLSAHPLDAFERVLARKRVRNIAEVVAAQEVGAVRLAGTFISKKEMTSKTGKRFAFISFSDPSGVFEATAFSEILSDYSEMLVAGNSMIVDCTANFEGDMPRLTIQGLLSIDAAAAEAANAAREMHIFLDDLEPLGPLSDVLARGKADNGKKAKGRVLITARLRDQDEEVDIKLSEPFQLTHELSLAVRSLPGVLDVREL